VLHFVGRKTLRLGLDFSDGHAERLDEGAQEVNPRRACCPVPFSSG
jgi:hypothetical protein